MSKKFSLAKKIFIAMILGCLVGVLFNYLKEKYGLDGFERFFLDGCVKMIGTAFTNLIKAMVMPLVFVSISLGVASIGNLKKLSRVGLKIFLFYLGTTIIAVSLAIFLTKFIDPATNFHVKNKFNVNQEINNDQQKKVGIANMILESVPTNPIQSFVQENMLQIIFLAILLGVAITLLQEKSDLIKKFLEQSNEINLTIINMIMNFAPIGVFCLITYTFSNFGIGMISSMAKYIFVFYLALIFHTIFVYSLMLKIFTGLNVKKFWQKFWPVASVAFSTASSNASLPISIKASDNMGVSKNISSFALSLGATINMNGTSIMHGITVVFLAHIYNVNLSLPDLIKVVCTSTLASIGTAGVPGVGMLMMAMVLKSINIPAEGLAIVLGIDRILDAGRTVVNVMGDSVCTLIVAFLEKEFDRKKFDS